MEKDVALGTSLVLEISTMWEALVACDAAYDGQFYYGVTTTGIYCRPSCKSKTPLRENVVFFINPSEAKKLNFRHCKRCRPDLENQIYNPIDETVNQVRQFIETKYNQPLTLDVLAILNGISTSHLQRLFKGKTGITPKEYLEKVRVENAKRLLRDTEWNNTDIGFAVGFQSLSSFYFVFQKHVGLSPKVFRSSFK